MIVVFPPTVRLVRVPTEVIAVCAAVVNDPVREVAESVPIPEIFELALRINALDAAAVPAVIPVRNVKSVATPDTKYDEALNVPFTSNLYPGDVAPIPTFPPARIVILAPTVGNPIVIAFVASDTPLYKNPSSAAFLSVLALPHEINLVLVAD